MSQLFDSLRRDADTQPRTDAPRTAHGDAVLATLGYARVKRRQIPTAVVWAAVALAILGLCWAGWRLYDRSEPARPFARATATPPSTQRQSPNATLSPVPPATPAGPGTSVEAPAAAAPALPPAVERRKGTPSPVASPEREPVMRVSAIAPASPETPASAHPATMDDLELALYYHRAGDFENALQHYRALLQKDELNAQVHNNLGLLYQDKNLLQESARELQRAILIEPRNAGARSNYGVTLLLQGKVDEATAQFRAVLGLDSRNLDALVNLAIAQRTAGQVDLAKETLLKALAIAPRSAAAHYNLGQLYDQTNEPARAVEHYRTFLDTAGAEHASRAAAVRARIAALSRTPE